MRRLATCAMPLLLAGCVTSSRTAAIQATTVDLRAEPHTEAQADVHDALQETQLLYGEQVRILKSEDGWSQIEAMEQPEFTHARRWQGYPGWVPDAALSPSGAPWPPTIVITIPWAQTWQDAYRQRPSTQGFAFGTMLRAEDMGGHLWKAELLDGSTVWLRHDEARSLEELAALAPLDRRRLIIDYARQLVGQPYYWGGRSPVNPQELNKRAAHGLDCSGLTNLIYRAADVQIPRDAHEQHVRAKAINALQPADLIFLSEKDNPERIVHVMVYAGEGELIEAPGTGSVVRRITVAQRLGHPLDWLAPGVVIDGQTVTFGSYLP